MNPNRGIVRMYRRSDSQYTIPDNPNTLTHQSVGTKDATRDPLHGNVTWNHVCFTNTLFIRLRLHPRYIRRHCNRYEHTATL